MSKTPYLKKQEGRLKNAMLILLVFICSTTNVFAQSTNISGKVIDEFGDPLIGVTVHVENTVIGTLTDIDGRYAISVNAGDKLDFSFIGMKSQSVTVTDQSEINITLKEDSFILEEAVVIGYGSAKSKDLTSPIASIKGDELSRHVTTSPMQAMQGKVPGIQIVNTGQPGSSPKVRIRGIGNYDSEKAPAMADRVGPLSDKQGPLYVVDGMFFDDISFLGNNDIESMNILKDASAAAIYGVRAANGVIIITTKGGLANSKPRISYDGHVGLQKASNMMKMANTEQYTAMMREAGVGTNPIEKSIGLYGGANGVPFTNTDWYDELTKIAFQQSHSLNVNGGSENITYAVGAGYINQDGIMDHAENDYERVNLRTKVDIKLLSNLKIGANFVMTNSTQNVPPEAAWSKAFVTPPMVPVYDDNNTAAHPVNFASTKQIDLDEYFGNPIAQAYYQKDRRKVFQVLPTVYAELTFFEDKLSLRSSFSQNISNGRQVRYNPVYEVSTNQRNGNSKLEKGNEYQNNYIIDNIVTYRNSFAKHNFTIMGGNSVRKERYEFLYATANDVPANENLWYINQGTEASRKSKDAGEENRGVSFFGRLMYNFDERYLVSATMRADGSSKYQTKWGYFPSVGLGWVPTQEAFFKEQHVLEHLKIRGSWGKLGNDKVKPNYAFAPTKQDLSTTGIFNDAQVAGMTSVGYFKSLKWEVVEEFNVGFDFTTLNNRLSGEFDYYKRTTLDAVFDLPLGFGGGNMKVNNGKIENSGIEATLNWNDKVGKDFKYNVGFNLATLKNKVTYLNGRQQIPTGEAEFRTYRMLGHPIDSFYGYEVVGVYQNWDQVNADRTAVENGLEPGDFIYKDVNGDGIVDLDDKTIIGSKLPKLTIGGNIGFEYKNIDFGVAFFGQFGHKIANKKRGLRRWQDGVNFDADLVENRWTGEGSTNDYPSAKGYFKSWNRSNFNSFIVESANNFSIQNIQLGYTFTDIIPGSNKNLLRLSFTAERPFSFFSYNGFTTDIEDGIDMQTFPLASTYSFGIKLTY